MEYLEEEINGVSVITFKGRIDSQLALDLESLLQNIYALGRYRLVLNMADVRYMSSAGLRTLADILTKNRENGGDLKLVALNPKVLRVFEVIGFNNFFSLYDTTELAIADF
ncbi:MAG: STAS domain-containing protein [Phototrophicales bacterium]|nr:STAS domain-containing protein [Phototrophicales bacterium]